MEIGSANQNSLIGLTGRFSRPDRNQVADDGLTEAERLKAVAEKNRSEIIGKQETGSVHDVSDDVAYLREHGFSAYAEKIHLEKIEKMREEILEAMGLSEDELSQMSGEQRSAIESMIAQEIQKRLAAAAMVNNQDEAHLSGNNAGATGHVDPKNLLAAQAMGGGAEVFATLKALDDIQSGQHDPAHSDKESKDKNNIIV